MGKTYFKQKIILKLIDNMIFYFTKMKEKFSDKNSQKKKDQKWKNKYAEEFKKVEVYKS